MAKVVVTMRIMPEDPSVNLNLIKEQATKVITELKGEVGKLEIQPIAFGLNAVMIYFIRDESLGGTSEIEKKISEIKGVDSAEVTDVRRTVG